MGESHCRVNCLSSLRVYKYFDEEGQLPQDLPCHRNCLVPTNRTQLLLYLQTVSLQNFPVD
jgi:hypothetical protein